MNLGDIPVYDGDDVPDLNNIKLIDRYTPIDDKLAAIAASAAVPPAWLEAWQHSTRGRTRGLTAPEEEASPQERLAVWKAIRGSGDLPEDATFYLVAEQLKSLADLRIAERMAEVERRVDEFWVEGGLGAWRSRSAPERPHPEEFRDRCPTDWDLQYVQTLLAHGEEEMARLYRTDRERFEKRLAQGAAFFVPPQPHQLPSAPLPEWLEEFRTAVITDYCLQLVERKGAWVDAIVTEEPEHTALTLYLSNEEQVGGRHDGSVYFRTFLVDVERLRAQFDVVHACEWIPYWNEAQGPPYIEVDGTYRGLPLRLSVLSMPPDSEGAVSDLDLRPPPVYEGKPPDLDNVKLFDRYTSIDDKLAALAAEAAVPPPWLEAWQHSTRGRTSARTRPKDMAGPEERLVVWKAVRNSGDLPEDATFFLVADEIRGLTLSHVGTAMAEIERRADKVWAEHGFEEWRAESPRAWRECQEFPEHCPEDWDRLYVEALQANSEEEMARLYLTDRQRFEARLKAGSTFFRPHRPAHSPAEEPPPDETDADHRDDTGARCDRPAEEPTPGETASDAETSRPGWLEEFRNAAIAHPFIKSSQAVRMIIEPAKNPDHHELTIYLSAQSFILDVDRLRGLFDVVHGCEWIPFKSGWPPRPPHVWIDGTYHGQRLQVRVLSVPPLVALFM